MADFFFHAMLIAGLLLGPVWSMMARRRPWGVPRYIHFIAVGSLVAGVLMYVTQPSHPWDGKQVISVWFVLLLPSATYWAYAFYSFAWVPPLLRLTRLDRLIAYVMRTRPGLATAGVWLVSIVWLVATSAHFPSLAWFVAVLIPVRLGWKLWRRLQFLRANRGRWFIVASRRHGWFEFLQNNVVPALAGATVVWNHRRDGTPGVIRFLNGLRLRCRTPYLVVVGNRTIDIYGLHDLLLPLKRDAKRSVATQRAVANLIAAAGAPVADESRPN